MSEIHEEMEDKNVVKSAGEASRLLFFFLIFLSIQNTVGRKKQYSQIL